MKVNVYDLKGAQKGSHTAGKAFTKPVRTDLIKRAVAGAILEEARRLEQIQHIDF